MLNNGFDCRKRPRKASREDNIKLMRAMNYTKVLTPKNMKSEVWSYFGFPGNANNEIVTKNVLICTICYAMFRNNRNTTNLRMHVERVHKVNLSIVKEETAKSTDIFDNTETSDMFPISPLPSAAKLKQARPKMKIFRSSDLPDFQVDDETTYDPLLENSIDIESAGLLSESSFHLLKPKEEVVEHITAVDERDQENQQANIVVSFTKSPIHKPLDLNISLRDMLITDLLSPSILKNEGMRNFIQTVAKLEVIPDKEDIEKSIKELYAVRFAELLYELKFVTTKSPFALSYEIWDNVENSVFITFYFHYLATENNKETLKEVLLKTVKLLNDTNFDDIFEGFNMNNCSAVIAAYSTDFLELFFSKKKIPILPCFECIVKNCIGKIFSLASVEGVYTEIKDTLQDFAVNHEVDTPSEYRNSPWAKYNVLKFFVENIAWPDDINSDLLLKARNVLETLSPLKITMESLAEEPDALNSVANPLAKQLIDNHFRTNEEDNQIVAEIKETIYFEFTNNIMVNETFNVTAFLDPRFQQYLGEECLPIVKEHLTIKAKELNILKTPNEGSSEAEYNFTDNRNSERKGLKILFGNKESTNKRHFQEKSNLENDIEKYIFDANVDLDESPLDWWNRYGYMYGSLRKIAAVYNTIPCLCTKVALKPIEKQIEVEDRRLNLTGNLINEILFLNYNFENNNFSA